MGHHHRHSHASPITNVGVPGLPLEYGDRNVHAGLLLRCVDDFDAEPWLVEDHTYTFQRWGNKGLLQLVEHPGVNFRPSRFVAHLLGLELTKV